MKHWTIVLSAVVALAVLADVAMAQRGPGRQGQPGADRRQGQPGGGRMQGQPGAGRWQGQPGMGGGFVRIQMPVMVALDADKDGELSAEEIKNASKALATLDKNKDGKLDAEELRPARPEGFGPGRGRPGAGPGGPGAGPGGPGMGPGGPGMGPGGPGMGPGRPGMGPGAGPGGGGQPRGPGGPAFVERIMSLDKNKDGKISKEELPERMQRLMERADTNEDGELDKEELDQLFERLGQGGPARGAGRAPAGRGGAELPMRSRRPE